jgi:very-short-patch-repair endonuclease
MFDCNRCERKFDNYESLRRHVGRIHKINSHDFFVEFKLNGIYPTCKCGCNQKTKWNVRTYNFCNFIAGHQSKIHNNWGHNKNAIEHSAETRRKQYASGERKVWNDGLTVDNPSVYKNIQNLIEKSKSPEERQRKSEQLSKYLSEHGYKMQSQLEKDFKKNFIEKMNIKYEVKQFYVKEIKAYYDIKIENRKILIEIDGDFWHSNPNKWPNPIFESQIKVNKKDKIKTEWASDNGYKLLRFWESDIKNEPAKVMKILLENIYAIK